MSGILGILLVLHGLAHAAGFLQAWGMLPTVDAAARTTILGGALDVGVDGMRALGLAWLATALALVAAGAGALREADWWRPLAVRLVGLSLALCLLQLPEAWIGLVLNGVVLALLAGGAERPAPAG